MTKVGRFRRFGLVGYPLGHSLSPFIHERIMQAIGVQGEYRLYELEAKSLPNELPKLLDELDGFNCTIPYKETIISYLDQLAPSAALYRAVNTVFERTGHNTDGAGFVALACGVPMQGRRVCVLGAGGVARVMVMEAIRVGAREIVIQARNLDSAEVLVREVREKGYQNIYATDGNGGPMDCDVLLNGTPVGMWPHVGGLPATDGQIGRVQSIFDSVYNPTATRLVLSAKSRGAWAKGGLDMLFEQALAAQKIWNPETDFTLVRAELNNVRKELAREVLRSSPIKLVFTGFMGSGKTHVGQNLAQTMSLPFVDLDDVVAQTAGQSIPMIFSSQGEEGFRALERQAFLEQLERPEAMILATGGGTLMQEALVEAVRDSNALVIWLDVPLRVALERTGLDPNRPLLQRDQKAIHALYEQRRPVYAAVADLAVPADAQSAQIVETIKAAFGWNI